MPDDSQWQNDPGGGDSGQGDDHPAWLDDPERFHVEPVEDDFDRPEWVDPETGRISVRAMILSRQGEGGVQLELPEEEHPWSVKRLLAVVGVAVAAVLAAYAILSYDNRYRVGATFQNASQLAGGEWVTVGGTPVGNVTGLKLSDQNLVDVEMSLDDSIAPIPQGTTATIRNRSLAGIAQRHIELVLPPPDERGEEIADGGELSQADAISGVDIDHIFNTLSPKTVKDLKKVVSGFATSYTGVEEQANKGFRYLNPFLSSSRRVFEELNRDQPTLERLIVDADRLSGALAERRDSVAGLVANASSSMGALAAERSALADSISRLPGFMRQFNTTAVNIRAALDDVDPLVDAAKPAAEPLEQFVTQLNSATENLVPTVEDLNQTIDRPKTERDLVGVTRLAPSLAQIAVGPVNRNGAERRGAFGETAPALRDSVPLLEQLRPYTPELVGWFNDFGPHSGVNDFNGAVSRFSLVANQFSVAQSGLPLLNPSGLLAPGEALGLYDIGNDRRCPGSNERPAPDGSNPFTDGGNVSCDPTQLPTGN